MINVNFFYNRKNEFFCVVVVAVHLSSNNMKMYADDLKLYTPSGKQFYSLLHEHTINQSFHAKNFNAESATTSEVLSDQFFSQTLDSIQRIQRMQINNNVFF